MAKLIRALREWWLSFGETYEPDELDECGVLIAEGLVRRQGRRIIFARDLLDTLRGQELEAVAGKISQEIGLPHRPSADGETVAGVYRRRLALSSGRFAMIDDGLGFHLVPWQPGMERHLGRHVAGVMANPGSVVWNLNRERGLGI